jgi:outer membrane protein assembly factor BamB
MTTINSASMPHRSLRLWPGITIALATIFLRYVLTPLLPDDVALFGVPYGALAVGAGIFGALAIVLWWLFFSRAPWSERIGVVLFIAVAMFATMQLADASIRGGFRGLMVPVFGGPVVALALVAGAVLGARLARSARRAVIAAAILLACGAFTVIRTDGVFLGGSDLHWRWTPTAEQRLLAEGRDERLATAPGAPAAVAPAATAPAPAASTAAAEAPVSKAAAAPEAPGAPAAPLAPNAPNAPGAPAAPAAAAPAAAGAEWPGFRGPDRDGIVRGIRISTDWTASPPVEIWRRPIGPGWSSFAVQGDLLYTQEQRGEEEMVACYRVSTGEPVWQHRDSVRFYESNGGPGPRGTPTWHGGRVYAFGATGILNALDARTGARIWSRNVTADLKRQVPEWGFTSSPVVIDDVVIVAASGTLTGYDVSTGEPRWVGPRKLGSYSSAHRATIDGVPQVLLLTASGATSVSPSSGKPLWDHEWPIGATTITQPAVTSDGVVINAIAATGGIATRRLRVAQAAGSWHVEERWTSNGLKPYFNDFVIHKGHAYGFDGSILASIGLEDGVRKWKGGRFGNGQLMLLEDQDLLLVLSEEGELALVSATPDKFTEVARMRVFDSKTWNHPVVVGDTLLVRNGAEMAAFRLPRASR